MPRMNKQNESHTTLIPIIKKTCQLQGPGRQTKGTMCVSFNITVLFSWTSSHLEEFSKNHEVHISDYIQDDDRRECEKRKQLAHDATRDFFKKHKDLYAVDNINPEYQHLQFGFRVDPIENSSDFEVYIEINNANREGYDDELVRQCELLFNNLFHDNVDNICDARITSNRSLKRYKGLKDYLEDDAPNNYESPNVSANEYKYKLAKRCNG